MEMKVLINEKNVLEMEIGEADQSLAQLIAERLTDDKDVEFASYKLEHPTAARPKLYVRTKKGDAAKAVIAALKEIKAEVAEFKKQFGELAK